MRNPTTIYGRFEYWIERARGRCISCYGVKKNGEESWSRLNKALQILDKAYESAKNFDEKDMVSNTRSWCNGCNGDKKHVVDKLPDYTQDSSTNS